MRPPRDHDHDHDGEWDFLLEPSQRPERPRAPSRDPWDVPDNADDDSDG